MHHAWSPQPRPPTWPHRATNRMKHRINCARVAMRNFVRCKSAGAAQSERQAATGAGTTTTADRAVAELRGVLGGAEEAVGAADRWEAVGATEERTGEPATLGVAVLADDEHGRLAAPVLHLARGPAQGPAQGSEGARRVEAGLATATLLASAPRRSKRARWLSGAWSSGAPKTAGKGPSARRSARRSSSSNSSSSASRSGSPALEMLASRCARMGGVWLRDPRPVPSGQVLGVGCIAPVLEAACPVTRRPDTLLATAAFGTVATARLLRGRLDDAPPGLLNELATDPAAKESRPPPSQLLRRAKPLLRAGSLCRWLEVERPPFVLGEVDQKQPPN